MFIAHLLAAYLLSRYLIDKTYPQSAAPAGLLLAGLIASVLPDLDLFYFYLIDQRQHPHHSYWSHIPIYWAGLFLLCMAVALLARSRFGLHLTMLIFVNLLLHLLLDSWVGAIHWFYPVAADARGLIRVPARYDWWVLSFMLHWSFGAELLICLLALIRYRYRSKGRAQWLWNRAEQGGAYGRGRQSSLK